MAEYWGMFFKAAAGSNAKIEASDEDHPLLPRSSMFAEQETVVYKPDAADVALLGGIAEAMLKTPLGRLYASILHDSERKKQPAKEA